MTDYIELLKKIEKLPAEYISEASDFIDYLYQKALTENKIDTYKAMDADGEFEVGEGTVAYGSTAVSPSKQAVGMSARLPISHYFGILSPDTYGDGVAYQRSLRDEWDD
jgi:hypothetical protein